MAAGSRLFAITSPDAAAVVMLTGASLGLPPIAAMRGIHVVSGKPVLSSDMLVAVVRRSGLCDVWEPVEVTNAACTIRTHHLCRHRPSLRIASAPSTLASASPARCCAM